MSLSHERSCWRVEWTRVWRWDGLGGVSALAFAVGSTSLYWIAVLTQSGVAYFTWLLIMIPGVMVWLTGSLLLGAAWTVLGVPEPPEGAFYALASVTLLAAGFIQAMLWQLAVRSVIVVKRKRTRRRTS
jgi:hypothetical protein